MNETTVKQIAVTYELCCNTTLSSAAMDAACNVLESYPDELVSKALMRCQREVHGKLSLSHIIERIDDGRPSPNEAWAMVPKGENESTCWTDETAYAWSQVRNLHDDRIAQRMAFIDSYRKAVQTAREFKDPVRWMFSAGLDAINRVAVLEEAVRKGRISDAQAKQLSPELPENKHNMRLQSSNASNVLKRFPTTDEVRKMMEDGYLNDKKKFKELGKWRRNDNDEKSRSKS